MSEIIEFAIASGNFMIDFDNRQLSITRDTENSKVAKFLPSISVSFSDVTDIEMIRASLTKILTCNFIIKGYRLTTNDGVEVCQVMVPKAQVDAFTSAIARVASECNLTPRNNKNKSIPTITYEEFALEVQKTSIQIEKEKASVWDKNEGKEHRMRCNVCGKVFCYTDKDISDNLNKGIVGAVASISAFANAVGGTMYGAFESDKMADRNKMRDFSKCPYCNSSDLTDITEEDTNPTSYANQASQNAVSVADEIKKFKELLDMGAITQEEFDAKKKQLLGL